MRLLCDLISPGKLIKIGLVTLEDLLLVRHKIAFTFLSKWKILFPSSTQPAQVRACVREALEPFQKLTQLHKVIPEYYSFQRSSGTGHV